MCPGPKTLRLFRPAHRWYRFVGSGRWSDFVSKGQLLGCGRAVALRLAAVRTFVTRTAGGGRSLWACDFVSRPKRRPLIFQAPTRFEMSLHAFFRFQRWGTPPGGDQVPKGRLKSCARSTVPSGLMRSRGPVPNVETLGYSRASLRDETHIPVILIGCPRGCQCGLGRSIFSAFPSNCYELMVCLAFGPGSARLRPRIAL